MERIWAPWRLSYIQPDKETPEPEPKQLEFLPEADPECFICQAVVDDADQERYVIDRQDHSITILNRFPYNNGHLLIAPRRHKARLSDLTDAEHTEMSRQIGTMVDLLEKVLNAQGFNVGLNLGSVGGAGLPGHLHWHIVPRWNGDTNFMPVLGNIRVIPQSLDALWEVLTEAIAEGK